MHSDDSSWVVTEPRVTYSESYIHIYLLEDDQLTIHKEGKHLHSYR